MPPKVAPAPYPFPVEAIPNASLLEWRTGETLPPSQSERWQLVCVRDGIIEETCDDRVHLLRNGGILFHQPTERYAMRAIGELPPEVLRVEFDCSAPAMDLFRRRVLVANVAERSCLRSIFEAVQEVFADPPAPDMPAPLRGDAPFGAQQLLQVQLERLLLMLARRLLRTRKPSARSRHEQNQMALVEAVRVYFAQNISRSLTLEEVCQANDCGRVQLQQAFKARLKQAPMEYFERLRMEQAAVFLAQGYAPGRVAALLGFASAAYFSQRFKAVVGQSPRAYAKAPQPLHLCNK